MARLGASFVVHVMSEADLRWNPGTMAELVQHRPEYGLQPWLTPWAVGGVFGGETASYAVGEHPEACQRDSDGRHLPALCPRQPVFRALMTEPGSTPPPRPAPRSCNGTSCTSRCRIAREPSAWACRCDACQEAFRRASARTMPESATPDVEMFLDDLLVRDAGLDGRRPRAERGMQSLDRPPRQRGLRRGALASRCAAAGRALLRQHAVLAVSRASRRRQVDSYAHALG